MTKEELLDRYPDEELMIADGFDDAIIGIDESSMRVIYSESKCIDILMKEMDREDALEFFSFNISGAYMGEQTPIWCSDIV